MRLIEADGKELLRRRGLPVPRGVLHRSADGIAPPAGPVAVKAQMLAGGRGKAGLVQLAAPERVPAQWLPTSSAAWRRWGTRPAC